ncbi:hypothetical protein V496_00864 [Pseudogymnoascus sp. VKM F-4515 (FW-2607)]|nr:hypothetical protein V496_00864 [Pseudogymnoascus sp. VKM F-4515 (FW-2607)]
MEPQRLARMSQWMCQGSLGPPESNSSKDFVSTQLGGSLQVIDSTDCAARPISGFPHQVDSARASFVGIITVDELAEIGQLCGDTEARHGDALIKRPMAKEFTSQASPQSDEKLQCVLFSVGPAGYYERMALQERPEADGGNP